MIKTFYKYFAIVLTMVLIQSNFSFAITQMLCKMGKTQTACECQDPCTNKLQISSEESQCCKILKKEINNKNILELNKLSVKKDIKFLIADWFVPINLQSGRSTDFRLHIIHFKPPADIPILFSHILI